jgi:hypothetical protein
MSPKSCRCWRNFERRRMVVPLAPLKPETPRLTTSDTSAETTDSSEHAQSDAPNQRSSRRGMKTILADVTEMWPPTLIHDTTWLACLADAGVTPRWSVGVADGFVDAAARCSPGHLARSRLGEVPAGRLLRAVMPSAERREATSTTHVSEDVSAGVNGNYRSFQPRPCSRIHRDSWSVRYARRFSVTQASVACT